MPLIVLQGSADEVIPPKHGKALFDAVGSKNKKYVLLPGGHHNDLRDFGLFQQVDGFLSGLN